MIPQYRSGILVSKTLISMSHAGRIASVLLKEIDKENSEKTPKKLLMKMIMESFKEQVFNAAYDEEFLK